MSLPWKMVKEQQTQPFPWRLGFLIEREGKMLDFFLKGGPVMYPLLICSIISLAIIFERTLFWFRLNRNRDEAGVSQILELAEKEDYESAWELGRRS